MFQILTPSGQAHLLDVESKFTALKPLLDSLTPPTVFRGSGHAVTQSGLSIIIDDTDGESNNRGVIRQLESIQAKSISQYKVRLVIEEVPPW